MSEKELDPNEEVLPIDEASQSISDPPEDLPDDGDPIHPDPIKP